MALRRFQDLRLNTNSDSLYDDLSIQEEDGATLHEGQALDINPQWSTPKLPQPSSANTHHVSQLQSQLRARGKSITFDPKVKLDSGEKHNIESPLPKENPNYFGTNQDDPKSTPLEIPNGRPRRHSDAETIEYDPVTGESLEKRHRGLQTYHKGELRHPLLQTTVDELAGETSRSRSAGRAESVPSLTSEVTASLIYEDLRTPVHVDSLSPLSPSSPMVIGSTKPGGLPSRKSVSQRSFGSLGSVGRRHTLKSAGSSLSSPARSWLSNYTTSAAAIREPDPDEEGQEIRDPSGPIYIIGRQIGYGGFSTVKEATTIVGDKRMVRAVKIVRKQIKNMADNENDKVQHDFEREVDVWKYLSHQYILPLIAAYNTDFATFCITKLNGDGTLFDLMRSRRKLPKNERGLPSHLAKRYIYQLGSAIRYLHEDARVVHRDIKPENCLLDMSDQHAEEVGGNILLCDFGMADWIQSHEAHEGHNESNENGPNVGPSQTSTAIQGSLEYAAPEMLRAGRPMYSTAADIWAFGCCLYTILTCERPFSHEYQPKLVMMIQKGTIDMSVLDNAPAVREAGGEYAKELVLGCMHLDVDARLGIGQILESRWLEGCAELYEESESF